MTSAQSPKRDSYVDQRFYWTKTDHKILDLNKTINENSRSKKKRINILNSQNVILFSLLLYAHRKSTMWLNVGVSVITSSVLKSPTSKNHKP